MRALRLPTHASPVAYLFRFRCPRDPSLVCARCCQRSRADGGSVRARIIVQPAIPFAGSLSHGREWDLSGSQAAHPVPLPRSKTPAEPTCLANDGLVDAAPASVTAKASALLISGLPRGLSGRTMARTGLRMMPTSPSSPLSAARRVFLVTAGRLAYQAGLSRYVDQLKPAPGIHWPTSSWSSPFVLHR